jgi:hypothetical protein
METLEKVIFLSALRQKLVAIDIVLPLTSSKPTGREPADRREGVGI